MLPPVPENLFSLSHSLATAGYTVQTPSPNALPTAEIARRLELPKQSAHRLVRQLESAGLLRRDAGGHRYEVGRRLVRLGLRSARAAARGAPVHAALTALVERIGETCNLGVLDRGSVVYLERVESRWPLRVELGAGSRVPIHATAIGKLLAAHLPARERRRLLDSLPLPAFTAHTITDRDALDAELDDIRRRGFACNREENVKGIVGFAVPVSDPTRRVVAGLSVHAPAGRFDVDRAERALPEFRASAESIGRLLCDDHTPA